MSWKGMRLEEVESRWACGVFVGSSGKGRVSMSSNARRKLWDLVWKTLRGGVGREMLLWRLWFDGGIEGGRQEAVVIPGTAPGSQAGATWREGRTHPSPRGGRGGGTELGNMDLRPGLASRLMSPWSSHASSLGSCFLNANKGGPTPWDLCGSWALYA